MSDADEITLADDHWEIYSTYVDDKPAVVMVDFGISKSAPVPGLSKLVWLWVMIKSPDSEGFPSDEEDMALNHVEDFVTEAFARKKIRYVGRITSDGRREFYFYSDDPIEFRRIVEEAMKSFPDYAIEIDDADDREWTHYWTVLYPSPEDFMQINSFHEINRLLREGDTLAELRPIDHFVNFKSEKDRDKFSTLAADLNFETVSRPENKGTADFPFSLGLLRVDSVSPQTIDDITFELFELAEQYNGEYEGWTSPVVKGRRSK